MIACLAKHKRLPVYNLDSNGTATLFNSMRQLGVDDGPGFGWNDIDVWKPGVVFRANPTLTLRATWQLDDNNALTFAYTHAFGETVEDKQSIPPGMLPGFGGGEADIYLREDIFGFSWNLKL